MIYRLKITLAEIEPPIWREVEVSDITLGDLHDVVQAAMGWENYHMHEFFIDDKAYADVSTADPEMKSGDEDRIRLSEIFAGRKNPTIRYMYDFGDSWLHAITLQACT